MDSVYRLQGIDFEWDINKAKSNLEKHGVSFEEATEVFPATHAERKLYEQS